MQDVLDAELQVRSRALRAGRRRAERDGGLRGTEEMAFDDAVRTRHAHEDVRRRGPEARDRDRLAREAALAAQRSPDEDRPRGELLPVRRHGAHPAGRTGAIRISTSPPAGAFQRNA